MTSLLLPKFCQAFLGDWTRALAWLEEALRCTRGLKDQRQEAELLWQQAICYAELGELNTAVRCGSAAVQLLQHENHPQTAWFVENLRRFRSGEPYREA